MSFHHVAISVRSLEESQAFYEKLGFQQIHRWDADDKNLIILHLKLNSVVLELFAYSANKEAVPLELQVANNLEQIGLKHIGLSVPDIQTAFKDMKEAGYEIGNPEVQHGRTEIDYFFIKDPDGVGVEIVQDERGY
jgi:glyoxylase I family protein